jgi:hypothetical protein
LNEGGYYSDAEFIAADGIFDGDGRFRCSYKNLGNNVIQKIFNITWHEAQTGVENSYGRIAAWFPILGNNKKKLNYSENVLMLSVQATVRLHNFIMNTFPMLLMSLLKCISRNTFKYKF